MAFWKLAYNNHWVTLEQLRQAVKTESNPYGNITADEFEAITGEPF